MILPILRLVLIYFLLVAGVVAVFNRDKLAPLLPGARDRAVASETAPDDAPTALAEIPQSDTPAPGASSRMGQDASPPAAPDAPDAPAASDTPVFPDPDAAVLAPPAPGGAPAAEIATDTAQPQQATVGSGAEGQVAAVAPGAPGASVPLGTPVAPAPAPQSEPALLSAPRASGTRDETAAATPAASAQDTAALTEAIGAARSAYWAGDIADARAQMEALVAAHPDNPDVIGELGNLAFALRDYPTAAETWHRAGLLLLERGEIARVQAFLPFLQSIAPDKAAELAAGLRDR